MNNRNENDDTLQAMEMSQEEQEQNEFEKKTEKIFEELGGFGRYQFYLLFTYTLSVKTSLEFILMSLNYLEKVPQQYFCVYEGSIEEISCTPKEFCSDPTVVSYMPNMNLSSSYENWVGKYDLACASSMKMGMIGSIYFIGFISTMLFLPRLSDVHGR